MRKILVAEDEQNIREFVVINLERAGYKTYEAETGDQALALYAQEDGDFDVAVLDIMMPGEHDGLAVCKELRRRNPSIGIILLSARTQEMDKVSGLMMGADDYVTKPFSIPVLLEKIRVILRRRAGEPQESCLRYRDLVLNPDTREVLLDGKALELTAREFALLHTFLSAPGRVFTREMLLARLWGYDFYGDERIVDSHIKNLRHKLGRDYIETVRGVGYRAAKEIH